MGSRDEQVVIVDENNRVVGAASRGVMRRFILPHRATYILVFNSQGELFLQQRTVTKDIYPGYYCPAAGGVVAAGETYEESAVRELAEELGIRGVPLSPLFDFYHEDPGNRVWGRAFSCVWDGGITLQAEEVAAGSFMSVDAALALAEKEHFTPDGQYLLRRWHAEAAQSPRLRANPPEP
ncbi:MAG: NUDIX hydrolase YfcD [Desulfobacteraceae bacterium]|nr:NUDIX hydrolase YfcD [Desulfobacteraceae bacterium]